MGKHTGALSVTMENGKLSFSGIQDAMPCLSAFADYVNGKLSLDAAYEKTAVETLKYLACRKQWTPIQALDAAETQKFISKRDAKNLRLRGLAFALATPLRGKVIDNPEKGIKTVTLEYDADDIPSRESIADADAWKLADAHWTEVKDYLARGFHYSIKFRKGGSKASKGKRITAEEKDKSDAAISAATDAALSVPVDNGTSVKLVMLSRVSELIAAYTANHADDSDAVSLESLVNDAIARERAKAETLTETKLADAKRKGKRKGKGKSIPDAETFNADMDAADAADAVADAVADALAE